MLELNPEKKLAGVLAPVFAIRGENDLGMGDTAALKEFITWSARQGLRVVQILPVNETGGDSSPYNLLSAMALEPSTLAVTPESLPDLTQRDFSEITACYDVAALRKGPVNYAEAKSLKRELLVAAFRNFLSRSGDQERTRAFAQFEKTNADWLSDYAMHRALVSWNEESEDSSKWPAEHGSPAAARVWLESLTPSDRRQVSDLIRFHSYVQWIAFAQWLDVRNHAEREGVALMGDVPVGVSIYSADVWRDPEIFDLSRSSGAPPEKVFKSDPFTEKWGQNWGFPLYHWGAMAVNDYAWWRRRLQLLMSIFHLLRVDHALGFFRIYSFPWRPEENGKFTELTPEETKKLTGGELPRFMDHDDETEENREYNRRHGETLFQMMLEETGPHRLIAEDLGEVAPYVRPALQQLEIPGFKIPQWERNWDRLVPGTDYQRLSLATYATHDHPPLKVHWEELFTAAQSADGQVRDPAIHSMWELMNFCGRPDIKLPQTFTPEIHKILLRGLFASNAWLVVHMITDLFGTGERFNVPGSAAAANWTERMEQPIARWDETWKAQVKIIRETVAETDRGTK